MKKLLLLCYISLISLYSFSQYSNETKILDFEDKYDYAEYYISTAEYKKAIDLYEDMLQERPNDMDIHFRLGFCYLFTEERYKSIPHLEKVVNDYKSSNDNKKNPPIDAYYYLAKAYYLNYDFESATQTYTELKPFLKKNKDKESIDKEIELCKNAEEIYMNPVDIIVTRLGAINSDFPDHSPVISADESILIFTSRRSGSTGGLIADDNYCYEDIYIYDKSKGFNSKPEQIGTMVNTATHEATCGLSFDGKELFTYKSTKNDQGDIYYSKIENNEWSAPMKLNDEVNSSGRESHASISADGKKLYFTSNRKKGEGGMDIYVAEKIDDGTWGNVKNLGTTINTEFDEEGPYIHPDGKTLYFSSQGHNTMGGFDVFTSELQSDGTWSEPTNLGFPLNTVDNDVFYVPTLSGNRAYYSSQQSGTSDIYIVDIFGTEKNLILVNGNVYDSEVEKNSFPKEEVTFDGETTTINGRVIESDKSIDISDKIYITDRVVGKEEVTVIDSACTVPYNTRINVIKVDNQVLDNVYEPINEQGKYMFTLYPKEEYLVYYESDGHVYDLNYIYEKNDGFYNLPYTAELDTLERGKVKNVKENPFEESTSDLTDRQKLELDILSDFMKNNDFILVNFSTHNKNEQPTEIDKQREEKAVEYLKNSGISEDRIFTSLSPNNIIDNTLEYTILDDITIEELKEQEVAAVDTTSNNDNINNITELQEIDVVFISNIRFDINKYKTNEYDNNLNNLAEYLINNPDAKINIFGYTDSQGPSEYNKQLSKKRANFVGDYLLNKGVNKEQISVDGKGFEVQIAKNKNESGEYIWDALEYNRRVEFVVTKNGENQKLMVEQIDVPEEYINDEISNSTYIYSIQFMSSKENKDLNSFDGIGNVEVFKGSDGYYNYYFGNFKNFSEAQKEQNKIKDYYPHSIIFINNF